MADGTQMLVKHALRDYRKGRGFTVMVSPVLWTIPPGSDQRQWYFMILSGQVNSGTGQGRRYAIDQIVVKGDSDIASEARSQFMTALAATQKPMVVHTFEDELELAEWAAAVWPGPKSEGILRGIQSERAGYQAGISIVFRP